MNIERIATFESRTMGRFDVNYGYDDALRDQLARHSTDPGIVASIGERDLHKRFGHEVFPFWVAGEGSGDPKALYTATKDGELAATFWVAGKDFPGGHFPHATVRAQHTVAFRSEYTAPDGGTYGQQGIAKRLALAGLYDHMFRAGGGGMNGRPSIALDGVWLETGAENVAGQTLYAHLGNTGRDQEPVGFDAVGLYTPEDPAQESRVAMVLQGEKLWGTFRAARQLVAFETQA